MDEFQVLFDLVGELARRRFRAAEDAFAPLGLNHTEGRLLMLLHRAGGAAPQETLAAGLSVDRTNAGRALQRLEREGLIERTTDQDDKRANRVRITARGKVAVAQIARIGRSIARGFFGDLTRDEAREAARLLKRALADDARQPS